MKLLEDESDVLVVKAALSDTAAQRVGRPPSPKEIVTSSSLTWTIVRAAVLKDEPATGAIVASNDRGTTKINRADVADFLVYQLSDATHERQAISISA